MPDQVYLMYNLRESQLKLLYEKIWNQVLDNGATITVSDLSEVIEEKVLEEKNTKASNITHHETAISNGIDIFLHFEMEDGLMGRIYDLLHLGIGHFIQWNSNENGNLEFYGDRAWKIATKLYYGASEEELEIVKAYELEAGKIALGVLEKIMVRSPEFDIHLTQSFLRFFNDYINTDMEYIINYYCNGVLTNFFMGWKFNSEKIHSKFVQDSSLEIPKKRMNRCVPLVRRFELN